MKISLPNFALFKRSLLLDNRHWQGYLFRFCMLGLILFFLFQFFTATRIGLNNAVGLQFLMAIGQINLVFISFIGISLFSSAITEEKEVDSLGLLLMTGTSPLSMLLSKGTGKLIMGLLLVISQFPFVLLSVTLGGVTTYQVASVFVTLLAYIILMNNLGLLCSVIFKRTSTASAATLTVVALFNILSPIFDSTRWLSPFYRVGNILQTFSKEPLWDLQATVYIALSILFFILAYLSFDLFCTKHTPASSPARLPKGIRFAKWNLCRVKRCWKNAIAWKAFYFDVGGKYTLLLTQLILLLVTFGVIMLIKHFEPSSLGSEMIGGIMTTLGFIGLFVEGIYIADNLFHNEVWSNTLSTLATTPYTISAIIWKKVAGAVLITMPTIIFTIIGLSLIPNAMSPFREPEFLTFITILSLNIVFYYQLVIFFSIIMKYGAFVIAFFVHGFIYALISVPLTIILHIVDWNGNISPNVITMIGIMLYLPVILGMYRIILKRIELKAAS